MLLHDLIPEFGKLDVDFFVPAVVKVLIQAGLGLLQQPPICSRLSQLGQCLLKATTDCLVFQIFGEDLFEEACKDCFVKLCENFELCEKVEAGPPVC